jgi:sugar lactone lactonase YvrE
VLASSGVLAAVLLGVPAQADASISTGALSQLPSPANCVGQEEEAGATCGTKVPFGLTLAYEVAVSPDGLNAYSVAISGDLTEYARNPSTGALSEIGCITSKASPCAASNSTDAVALMAGPSAITISPNGQNVYVTVTGQNAVVELERETGTGLLTIMGAGKSCVTRESTGECEFRATQGLTHPSGIAISPDEKDVYVAGAQNEALVELERNTTTGLLNPISAHECIGAEHSECPVTTAIGMVEPVGVTVSPDNKNVYVAAGGSTENGDVAAFKRESNGTLSQLSGETGCISEKISACASATGLQGSEGIAMSGDGKSVYATSFRNSAVVELGRNSATGALTQLGGSNHCISAGEITGCTTVKGVGGTRGVAVSQNGENVYVSSTGENAVAAFSRDTGSGALTQLAEPDQCVSSGSSSCATNSLVGLTGARRVALSPDGKNLYVAAQGGNAIAELARSEEPSVGEVLPTEGDEAGGTKVTIKGGGFAEGAKVFFGAKEASGVSFKSGSELTATSPAGKPGTVDVTVKTAEGTSAITAADKFTYKAPKPVVTSIAPQEGPESGSTTVTIHGEHLEGASEVKFGANAASALSEKSDHELTVKSPGGSATVDVTVTTPGGTSATGEADEFTYRPAPNISSLAPSEGPETGGTKVRLLGTNLEHASEVTFQGKKAVLVHDSAPEIELETPSHAAGAVEVCVTTTGGPSCKTNAFTYVAPPKIESLEPTEGRTGGATTVAINGQNLENASVVSFGGSAASVHSDISTKLEVETPSHAAGAVGVCVTTPGGSECKSAAFTYVPQPVVTSLNPAEGPESGGTKVRISGANLENASEVRFGGHPATLLKDAAGEVEVETPALAAGSVEVCVVTVGGSGCKADGYTYVAPPNVTAVAPSEGPQGGSTAVTITGEHLSGASEVRFGSSKATGLEVKSETEVKVKSPTGTGTVHVTVSTPGGTSATSGADEYTYRALPALGSLVPNEGPEEGGTSVTISGEHLEKATEVKFAGAKVAVLSYTSGEIEVQSPKHGAGAVEVCVITPGGETCKAAAFTYVAPPTVSSIAPKEGPVVGGTAVTIKGTHLTKTSEVTFGGTPATNLAVKSDTEVTVKSPSGAGSVDVAVKTPGGTAVTGIGNEFTYRAVPKVSSLTPDEGPTSGHTRVRVVGEHLEDATEVKFGSTTATGIINDSADEIEVEAPGPGSGTVHVTVTTAGGSSSTSAADQFTYRALPKVSALSPNEGPEVGGTMVTITGEHLSHATEVKFGSSKSAAVEAKSDTEVIAKSPGGTGPVHLTVSTPGGTSSPTASDEFSYRAPPKVGAVSPSEGPRGGGTTVTITGEHLSHASEVKFGAGNGTALEVKSETELDVKSPAGSGTVDVTVTTPGGTSGTGSPTDQFTYRPAPVFTSLEPVSGLTEGGTAVTIHGEQLEKASEVKFGGALAKILKDTAGEIEVTTPPHAEAAVEVCVSTSGGTECKSAAFTYHGPPPPKPVFSSLAPGEGSTAGGTDVKISGAHLGGATEVKFDTDAAKVLADSEAEIEVETKAHPAGEVQVCVTTGGGTSCKPNAFAFVAPPTVSTVLPPEGPEAGGTHVKVSGEHLANASAVEFAGTKATVRDDTSGELEVETPVHAPGKVELCITTPGGRACVPSAFIYRGIPTISSLTPSEGATAGGNTITIAGEHLEGVSEVKFGSATATNLEVKSDGEIKVKSPAGAGTVRVMVKTSGGESAPTGSDEFTYRVAPSVSTVSPKEGPAGGGAVVSITGEHLGHASEVRFGAAKATAVESRSENEVRATTPARSPGPVDVVVVTPGGQSATSSADRYQFVAKPLIREVEPAEGPAFSFTSVAIIGEHFQNASSVRFGGSNGSELRVRSAGELSVQSPGREPGTVDIVVTTPGGESATSTADHYTYRARGPLAPKVFSVSPTQGSSTGGTSVTVRGENFLTPTAVLFGGVEATNVKILSGSELTATSPAHSAGTVSVILRTAGGESANTEADVFTYVASPPAPGPAAVVPSTPPAPAALPAPVLASSGNLAPVSGAVLIELPGTSTFVPLTALKQIPFGTVIDATHGRVIITTAGAKGGTQSAEFFDGEFTLSQGHNGLVVATLAGGDFSVCPPSGGAAKARHTRTRAKRASPKHVVRELWANARGSFSTRGSYATGVVQGTEWLTEDLCEGTLIRVTRDKVRVTNLVNHRHASVRAGHRYLAKAP